MKMLTREEIEADIQKRANGSGGVVTMPQSGTTPMLSREEILSSLQRRASGNTGTASPINDAYQARTVQRQNLRAERYNNLVKDYRALFDENKMLRTDKADMKTVAGLLSRAEELYKERTSETENGLKALQDSLRSIQARNMVSWVLPDSWERAIESAETKTAKIRAGEAAIPGLPGDRMKFQETAQTVLDRKNDQDRGMTAEEAGQKYKENQAKIAELDKTVRMGAGKVHTPEVEAQLDALEKEQNELAQYIRQLEDADAMQHDSAYWAKKASHEEERLREANAYRSGYGGVMQSGVLPDTEKAQNAEAIHREYDKALEYYYAAKDAENWDRMTPELREKAMEAAALDVNGLFEWNKNYYYEKAAEEAANEWFGTTQAPEEKDMEGGIDWQKADALSRSGLAPDQRAALSRADSDRVKQIRQDISDAGFDADRTLDYANRLRNQQKMKEETWSMADFASGSTAGAIAATAASYGSKLLSGIGSVGILAQRIFGSGSGVTEYRPVDYNAPSTIFSQVTSATRGAVSSQMGEAGQFFYGTLNSAVDSAARMLVAKAIGTGFLPDSAGQAAVDRVNRIVSGAVSAQMSTQVFTDAFLAAKQSGATDDDAILDALVQAAIEGITEKYSVDAILKNPNNLVFTALRNNFIAEGSEEIASDFLNTIYDELKNGSDSELRRAAQKYIDAGLDPKEAWKLVLSSYAKQVVLDGLAGGISGLAMGGAAELADYTQRLQAYTQKGQQILDSGNYDTLQALAMNVAKEGVYGKGESDLSSFAEKTTAGVKNLNENRDSMTQRQVNRATRNVGKLADRVDTVRMRQNAADIQSSLEAKGMSARDAKKAAQLISENYEGLVDPEDKDLQREMAKPEVRETMKEIEDDSNSSVRQRNYRYTLGLMGLKLDENGVVVPVRSKTEEPAAESVTTAEADKNASVEISDGVSGKMQGIKWGNGILTATVTTEAGETVTAPVEDVSMPSEMQDLVAVSKQFGESAPAVYAAYQPGMGVAEYGAAMKLASDYGYTGVSRSYADSSEYLNGLHPTQISIAYEAGQAAWTKESTETMRTQSKGTVFANRKAGKVSMKGGTVDGVTYKAVDRSGMTAQQKAAVRNITRLAQVTGINFVFYQSEKNSEGKYSGANGIYTDNTIFLDINAGATDSVTEAAILRTAAHELTHFIEQFSKSEYRALQEFMLKNLEGYKGKTIDQLVAEKQARSKKDMSFQDAMSEIVADGCEMMLQDTRIMELLASEHEGIAKKISRWLKNWVEDLKTAFTGVEAVHEEARAMIAHAEELQKLWDNAIMQALRNREQNADTLENVQADHDLESELADAGIKYSERVTDEDTLSFLNGQKTITTYKTMQLVDGKLYPPMASRINGKFEDYSELGVWEQATEHPELIRENGKFKLDKGKGNGSIKAAYNPYMHSSNLVINDQFSGAYKRTNLVTVECVVPVSEATSGYHAQYAKDSVGWHPWHTGTVAGSIRKAKGIERQVFLSRWIKPVRIVSDSEVASMYKELLSGTDVAVPDNVVTPSLLKELKKAGVKIEESGRVKYSDRDYSYEALTAKPDMTVTLVDDTAPKNRADVVAKAKKNAAKIGRFDPKTGSVSVHVNDISGDVLLGTDGLKHGLRRTKDAQRDPSFIVTIKAGEIIQNSIRINEATPKKETATGAYVLIGAAQNKDGDLFIVRSMVNQFSNELDSIDVLYSINTKKELAATKSPRSAATPLSVTSSTISISDLLDYVNKYFPDILPEEVLKHYGYSRRPEGDLGDDMLFQDRDPDQISNRALLANALDSAVKNDIERKRLEEYRGKIDLLNSEEQKLQAIRSEIRELSFAKGPKDTKRISELQFEANKTANRINIIDRQLLRLEAAAPLQNVLQREKKMAYKRAEQKGKEALAAYREKTTKTQREIISRYQESRAKGVESRKKTAMRHKIQNVVNELNQYLLKGNKEKHVMIGMQKAVAEALDAINMDTVGAEERIAKLTQDMLKAKSPEKIQEIARKIANIQERGDNMKRRLESLKSAYAEIKGSDDPMIANAHDEVIERKLESVIESVGDTSLRDMTLDQLEDVYDMYKMVLTNIRNANKAFKAAKSQDIAVLGNNVMMEVEAAGGKRQYRIAGTDRLSEFNWNNLKPVYAFERIGSKTFAELFNNVRSGEDTWAKDITEAKEFSDSMKKKYGYNKWNFDKQYPFKSSAGVDFSLTLDQIMSLYAYSKRTQADDHLEKGGFVYDSNVEVVEKKHGIPVKYKVNTATAHNISKEILAEITGILMRPENQNQKAFVDEMQSYLSTTMGDKGNEVSLEMYGIKLFKEKFYFPLKSAKQFLFEQNETAGEVRVKNSGFTKEVKPHANNPIILTGFMDAWANHVNDMAMYHAFVLPLEDFNRVFNYNTPRAGSQNQNSVREFIQNAYGPQAVNYVRQLLKDLNGGARSDPRESAGKALVGRFKKAAVFASASVVIQQPSAVGRALALIDPKYFDFNPKLIQHKKLWAEVKKYAPVAIIKEMGYFDTDMGMSTVDYIKGEKTIMDKADDVLSWAPAMADELTWCHIWTAVKRETQAKNPGLSIRSEEFLQKAGARFTEVIVKTQVYDSVLSRSANMRSKSLYMKMLTSFMAEPTTSINMLQSAMWDLKRGYKGKAAKTIGAVVASVVLNSILVSFVYAGRDDDEDETWLEKYASSLATELVEGINPITYIPIAKDIWSLLQGYDVERADMTLFSSVTKSLTKLVKAVSVDTSDMDEEDLADHRKQVVDASWGLVDAVMSMTGIPVKNVRRDVMAAINTYKTVNNGLSNNKTSFWNEIAESVKKSTPVWIWLPDKKKGDKLYEAIVSGDKSYQERIESLYDSQNAIDSARVKALRDNDPRILEAATAAFNGDPGERVRIAREIVAEGHFSQADVIQAINAEINKLEIAANGGSESEKSSPKFYDMNDYYDAVMIGDKSTADDAKEYYLDDRIAQGDSEEDALNSFKTSFTSTIKSEYLDGKIGKDKVMSLLTTYGGSSESESETYLKKWDFEDKYGYSWDQRDNAFRLGDITMDELVDYTVAIDGDAESAAKFLYEEHEIDAGTAANMLVTYSGMKSDDAKNKVAKWEFKNVYGFSYDDRREAYISGEISAYELKKSLMDLGGMTSDEADLQIQVYDWEKEVPGCDDITASAIRDYDEYCYGVGISKRVYYDAWSTINDYEADYDENGNAIKDSRVIKVMPYINSLPLTADQKTAIALCFWKSKTVSKYRLW